MDDHALPVTGPPARFPRVVELAGRVVTLRALDPERDVDALYAGSHGDDERESVWQWMAYGPFADRDDMLAWLHRCAASSDTLFFAVHDPSSRAIGMASYLRIAPEARGIEIGHIWYTPAVQRSKVNTASAFLLIDEAFRLGYRRVEWRCHSLNERSRRAALRLGFEYEGTLRQHRVSKGRNRDTCTFSILDGEWESLRPALAAWLDETSGAEPLRVR